jgi:hypothetical protein
MTPRIKAAVIHLSLSAVVALLCLLLVFQLWYPSPLHTALNVTHIFLILLFVDVSLGPLLTLIVFKVGKKTLVFDLTVIAVCQISALIYGVWTVAEGRPAWIVFNVDRFDAVQVVDLDQRNLDQVEPQFQHASLLGPVWVGAIRPESKEERTNIMFEAAAGGNDIAQHPHLYRSLDQFSDQIEQRAQPLDNLKKYNPEDLVNKILADWPTATHWLPLKARAKPMVVLLDGKFHVLGIINLNPWE